MQKPKSKLDAPERSCIDPLQIGLNVKYMRYVRGWSQLDLCKRCGISRTTLNRIEEGKPSYTRTLQRIAEAFGTNITEIYVTTRFKNVFDNSKKHVKHCRKHDYWYALEDSRKSKPANSQELIQQEQERLRLGCLGYVPAFANGMEFLLPAGPGINRLEVYARLQRPNMPQFENNAIYCLKGSLKVVVDEETFSLEPGEACALHSSSRFYFEPMSMQREHLPCVILLVGSGRKKVE